MDLALHQGKFDVSLNAIVKNNLGDRNEPISVSINYYFTDLGF